MDDIDDLLDNEELDYEEDFGETIDSEDELMHNRQEAKKKDIDVEEITNDQKTKYSFLQNLSKEEKCEVESDDPQLSPLPPPDDDYDNNEPQSTSRGQQECDDESSEDELFASVFENWDDQEQKIDERQKNNFNINEEVCGKENTIVTEEEDEAEENRRYRSRFKSERTNMTFNTLVPEKKDIVDSLESVLVPQSGKGNLISFTIPKGKPQGLMEPAALKGEIHEPTLGQISQQNSEFQGRMSALNAQLQESKQIHLRKVDKKAHKNTVNEALKEIPRTLPDDLQTKNSRSPRSKINIIPSSKMKSPEIIIGNQQRLSKKQKKINPNLVAISTTHSLEQFQLEKKDSLFSQLDPLDSNRYVDESNVTPEISDKDDISLNPKSTHAEIYELTRIKEDSSDVHDSNKKYKDDLDEEDEDEENQKPRQRFKTERDVTSLTDFTTNTISETNNKMDIPDSLDMVKTDLETTKMDMTNSGIIITEGIVVPHNKVGRVIGKGGETMKQIKLLSGALVELDRSKLSENTFNITGLPLQVYEAKILITQKAQMNLEIPKPNIE
ncbi:unnamed protein product, partial [Meganyctiphanes norvegica]